MKKENIIEKITNCVNENIPICYLKFGDGEYFCVNTQKFPEAGDRNSDNDNYTEKKQKGLIESFKYIVNNIENVYIGAWHTERVTDFWESLVDKNKIKWADYHTFIIDCDDFNKDIIDKKIKMYESIQKSQLKKILLCNPLLKKAKELFKADVMINVPFNNWVEIHYENILNKIISEIKDNEQVILLTAGGMGAKILAGDILKKFPNIILLDIGSSADFICTKCDSRGRNYSYADIYKIFSPLLPETWHDERYKNIYINARQYMCCFNPYDEI